MRADNSVRSFIEFLFDRPVPYEWPEERDAHPREPEQIALLIAEMFENSGRLLERFSDAQLDQGLWFVVSGDGSEFMFSLVEEKVPLAVRVRALRSFVPLFEQVMALRCSPVLCHLDEPGAKRLNDVCYMWWDILPIHGRPDLPERRAFDAEVLLVLARLLAIPHDACRESALHGIGHWCIYYPELGRVVDDFLARTPDLRPELVAYAERARDGCVL
ncbi:MAG: hypothetical protein WHT82_00825 [Limisphaera sp.]